ncbi:MAG: hypothetical protein PUE91_04900 [Clostridiales bacterium]|nr:hypothetical protein [Clostridiales bacterium]
MKEEEMLDEMEDEEFWDIPEFVYPEEGPLTRLLLMGFPSDRIYLVYDCGEQYYFYPIGNEVFGIDPEKIPESIPTRAQMEENRKARIFDKRKISNCKLNRKRSISTQLDNCGSFHFTYDGKVQKFILLEHPTEEQIATFLSDVSAQFPPKTEAERKKLQKQAEQSSKIKKASRAIARQQDAETFHTYKLLGRIINIITVIVALGTLFYGEPYGLWVGLCVLLFALAYILCICRPAYFTPSFGSEDESQEHLITLNIPILCPVIFFLGPDDATCNILTLENLIIYTVVCAVLLAVILYFRNIDSCRNIFTLLSSLFYLFMSCFGMIGELNYVLDNSVPYDKATCEITDMELDTSSKGPDTYEITVDFRGEEIDLFIEKEDYERLQIGDTVPVSLYRGGLGIPFADIY